HAWDVQIWKGSNQTPVETSRLGPAPGLGAGAPQEGVRHPRRPLAPRAARPAARPPPRSRPAPAPGALRPRRRLLPRRRAPRRGPRPPQAALDVADVPALARPLARVTLTAQEATMAFYENCRLWAREVLVPRHPC